MCIFSGIRLHAFLSAPKTRSPFPSAPPFPLLGMRLNNTLKNSLIISQQETLSLTAQAVSAALTDRNDLFDREQFHGLNQDRDLYLFQLSNTIRLDGQLDDWRPELAEAEEFAREHLISSEGNYVLKSLNFRHLAGKQDKYLYALFDVQDDHVIYRSKNSLRLIVPIIYKLL